MKCPRDDCDGELEYFERFDEFSSLKVGIWKTNFCDNCGAKFKYKVLNEERKVGVKGK